MTVRELREALDQFEPYDRVEIFTETGPREEFEVAGPYAEGARCIIDARPDEDEAVDEDGHKGEY